MIEVLGTKEEITAVIERFSPYLQSLSSGMVDGRELAEKFTKYARVIQMKENGQIMGFAVFYCNDDKDKNAYLSLIAVSPKYRNRGVGKSLIDEVVEQSKVAGMKRLALEVRKSNRVAIKFYEKLGFILAKTNENTLHLSKII